MGHHKLRMRDFLTFQVEATEEGKKYLHECKDAESESGYSLLTYVKATHAGIVNGNKRFYRPDLMQASTHTWGPAHKIHKPVLVHHDRESDALGRIVKWQYQDFRHEYAAKYQKLNNLCFYDSVSTKRLDVFSSVNWVVDTLQKRNKDYVGLGAIQLGLHVTNPEAIGKVQRGEYATVSVGFQTDAAVCSVCHQDWAEDGRCEHKLGQAYEGRQCFLITGNQEFEECSFVTFPADKAAIVENFEAIQRAKDSFSFRAYLLGQHEEDGRLGTASAAARAAYTDMLVSDIEIVTDSEEEMDLEALRKEINGKDLTQERALEIRDSLAGEAGAKRLLSSLNAKILKNGWQATDTSAPTQEEVEALLAGLADKLAALPEAERQAYLDSVEKEASVFGLSVPVIGTDQAAAEPGQEAKNGGSLAELRLPCKDSEPGKTFVSKLEDLTSAYNSLDENERSTARYTIYQTYDILGDTETLTRLKARLQADPEQKEGIYDKQEVEELQDAVLQSTEQLKSAATTLRAVRETNKSLLDQLKRSLATTLVMYSVQAKELGFAGLDSTQIAAKIVERSQRQLVSLQDSLQDLTEKLGVISRVPKQADATEEAPGEESKETITPGEVSDNAKATEETDQPQDSPEGTVEDAQSGEDEVKVPLFATQNDLRALQLETLKRNYKKLKDQKAK